MPSTCKSSSTVIYPKCSPNMLSLVHIEPTTRAAFGIYSTNKTHGVQWMIPIHNENGESVGLITRDVVNRRDHYEGTIDMRKIVFNLNRVLSYGCNAGEITLTEDLYDCITIWQAGGRGVVSLLGSALSDIQLELLFKLIAPNRIRFICSPIHSGLHGNSRSHTIMKLVSRVYTRSLDKFVSNAPRLELP